MNSNLNFLNVSVSDLIKRLAVIVPSDQTISTLKFLAKIANEDAKNVFKILTSGFLITAPEIIINNPDDVVKSLTYSLLARFIDVYLRKNVSESQGKCDVDFVEDGIRLLTYLLKSANAEIRDGAVEGILKFRDEKKRLENAIKDSRAENEENAYKEKHAKKNIFGWDAHACVLKLISFLFFVCVIMVIISVSCFRTKDASNTNSKGNSSNVIGNLTLTTAAATGSESDGVANDTTRSVANSNTHTDTQMDNKIEHKKRMSGNGTQAEVATTHTERHTNANNISAENQLEAINLTQMFTENDNGDEDDDSDSSSISSDSSCDCSCGRSWSKSKRERESNCESENKNENNDEKENSNRNNNDNNSIFDIKSKIRSMMVKDVLRSLVRVGVKDKKEMDTKGNNTVSNEGGDGRGDRNRKGNRCGSNNFSGSEGRKRTVVADAAMEEEKEEEDDVCDVNEEIAEVDTMAKTGTNKGTNINTIRNKEQKDRHKNINIRTIPNVDTGRDMEVESATEEADDEDDNGNDDEDRNREERSSSFWVLLSKRVGDTPVLLNDWPVDFCLSLLRKIIVGDQMRTDV